MKIELDYIVENYKKGKYTPFEASEMIVELTKIYRKCRKKKS